MVVHRSSPSWESIPDRSGLVAVSDSNIVSFEQISPSFKHNGVQTFGDGEQGENLVEWVSAYYLNYYLIYTYIFFLGKIVMHFFYNFVEEYI